MIKKICEDLRAAANQDIWYDAQSHGDVEKAGQIMIAQVTMQMAADILQKYKEEYEPEMPEEEWEALHKRKFENMDGEDQL